MSKIEDWNREQKEYQNLLRTSFPKSTRTTYRKGGGRYDHSPVRSLITSETLSTTFRYRMTTAATLMKYFKENGECPQNVSQILRLAIETVEELVLRSRPEFKFESDTDAFHYLQDSGLFIDTSPQNHKRIANRLMVEGKFGDPGTIPGSQPAPTPDGSTPDQVMIETFKHLEERQKLIQQVSGSVETVSKSSEAQRLEENRQMALSRTTPIEVPVIDLEKPVGSAVESPEEATARRAEEFKAEKLAMLQMIQNASRKESGDGSENG